MKTCEDCIKFKQFEYKTYGGCTHQYDRRLIMRSDTPECKHFSDREKVNEERGHKNEKM